MHPVSPSYSAAASPAKAGGSSLKPSGCRAYILGSNMQAIKEPFCDYEEKEPLYECDPSHRETQNTDQVEPRPYEQRCRTAGSPYAENGSPVERGPELAPRVPYVWRPIIARRGHDLHTGRE